MSDDRNYQATSAPYSADNLKVHDKNLVFTREFGTNITDQAGDAFTTDSVDVTDNANSINSRMAMLETVSVDPSAPNSPRGTTFEVPPADVYSTSPLAGDPNIRFYTMYAHLLAAESTLGEPDASTAYLILADDGFVGNVPNAPFNAIAIRPEGGGPNFGEEAENLIMEFANGGDGLNPTQTEIHSHWGTNVYIRLVIIQDVTKQSNDTEVWLSRDGMTWTHLESLTGDFNINRVGIATSGQGRVWLDWLRTYDYVIDFVGPSLIPAPPLTGGRRFY